MSPIVVRGGRVWSVLRLVIFCACVLADTGPFASSYRDRGQRPITSIHCGCLCEKRSANERFWRAQTPDYRSRAKPQFICCDSRINRKILLFSGEYGGRSRLTETGRGAGLSKRKGRRQRVRLKSRFRGERRVVLSRYYFWAGHL